jgi:hypothetical protein
MKAHWDSIRVVYLCGARWSLKFCDMVFCLFGKIGRIRPCAGSAKQEGHLAQRWLRERAASSG